MDQHTHIIAGRTFCLKLRNVSRENKYLRRKKQIRRRRSREKAKREAHASISKKALKVKIKVFESNWREFESERRRGVELWIEYDVKKKVCSAAEISLLMFKYNAEEACLILIMSRSTSLVALLLLVSLVSSQTFTCSNSVVSGIASGIVRLGVPNANVAETSYSQSLAGSSLGTYAQVFSAFAIAGLEASSSQTYYSLVVDQVIFSNGNTQMNFTMNYNNPGGSFATTWTTIKLSYVAISTAFEKINTISGQFAWAGSFSMAAPFTNGIPGPAIANSIWSNVPTSAGTDAICGYVDGASPYYDLNCNTGGTERFLTHLYIMGFQFNPSGQYELAASVLRRQGTSSSQDLNEALGVADFVQTAAGAASSGLSGPEMLIDTVGSQLAYIKIGVVITVIIAPGIGIYPQSNTASTFQYAGVYMNYTLYNTAQPIIAANGVDPQNNYNYYTLLTARYQIYGLSSFYIATLPSTVTVVNYELTVGPSSSVLFQTDDVNYMTLVRISADQWSDVPTGICSYTATPMRMIVQKYLSTVPTMQNSQQTIWQTSADLNFNYFLVGSYQPQAATPLSAVVVFNNIMYFEQITVGAPYQIDFSLTLNNGGGGNFPNSATDATKNTIQYTLNVEGNQILNQNVDLSTLPAGVRIFSHPIGITFTSATPTVEIVVTVPRLRDDTLALSTALDRTFSTNLVVTLYSHAYDPLTDCCVTTCPGNSGISLGINNNPPMCVSCVNGMFYNPVTRNCECQTGHYSVNQTLTNETRCYPCFAPLCQSCNSSTVSVCNSCVTGAAVNTTTNICECQTGFFQNKTVCTACPIACGSCTTATICATCSDTTTRTLSANCVCNSGFYNSGTAICSACPTLCLTCSSATVCLSCNTALNRALVNGQCVCATGFFQVVNTDGSLTCSPCSPSCNACSLTADRCTDCSAVNNRILGYDANGNQVCNCFPGFHANAQGQCQQSNCTGSNYCSNCITVLGVPQCIKCIAATHRVLVLPQQKCECRDGYYDNNGICTPCGSGCAKCTSATACTQCVASSNTNNNGTCKCPDGFFFTVSPIRYCKRCANYTLTCTNLAQALTCQPNFNLTNGLCTCSNGRFINNLGQCQACITGCMTCDSSTSCQACQQPLLLQGNACVSRCGPGYYQNGFVCTPCSAGCAMCKGANICLICLSGQLSYNGFCYRNCPAGSVKTNSSSCIECNSPCNTCTEHPSKCTTCKSCCGNLFNFKCLEICPVGTYAINGSCQYCAYTCKSCLGSNTTCTACPNGKILYSGSCYDQCPYLMIGGICTFNCANGLYKTVMNDCKACDSRCATCDKHPSNCTTCTTAFGYAMNGVCVKTCPADYLGLDGMCKACNPECKGCTVRCDQCIACAVGYYKLGSTCVKTCYPNMFVDNAANICVQCSQKCKTCSSLTFCTTCANPQAVPVNGVCNDCSYPCSACSSSPSTCTSCVSGFNLIGTTCIAQCPTGAYPKNGICVCTTGVLFSSQCVSKCPTQHGNIGGICQKCNQNCAACDGSKQLCSQCMNGYALDQVSGVCQKAPSCQFGQYFSQSSNGCSRICPQNTYFYENVCLTSCLSGYNDNGVGGCIAATPQTGCSFPLFLSNGVCVSNCPSGSYPDTQNRICQGCSSNCFSCLTNTFCYACNAGYDLSKGICIKATRSCATGEFRYNGNCYRTCPAGTCEQGSFCQRTCPAGTWSYNQGCYRTCPTKLTTADACVETCPAGTTLVNGVCQVGSQSCPQGQYRDGTSGSCQNCQYPCSRCTLTASYCTACSNGLTLKSNLCVSNSNQCRNGQYQNNLGNCQDCAAKCNECISADICSSCANGYNFNGQDCVKAIGQLKSLSLKIKSTSKRGNTAFITVCPNIIPNGLSSQQKNNFFTVVPAKADQANVAYINQWLSTVDSGCVTVGVNYNSFPVQTAIFLAVNAQLLASTYMSIGYKADASSFVSAAVNINLPQTPDNVIPPSNAQASFPSLKGEVDALTYASITQEFDNLL